MEFFNANYELQKIDKKQKVCQKGKKTAAAAPLLEHSGPEPCTTDLAHVTKPKLLFLIERGPLR